MSDDGHPNTFDVVRLKHGWRDYYGIIFKYSRIPLLRLSLGPKQMALTGE